MYRKSGVILGIILLLATSVGCSTSESPDGTTTGDGITLTREPTYDPQLIQTLQSEVIATAESLSSARNEVTATPDSLPTADVVTGEALSTRTGPCPVPEGFELQEREGFCISVPRLWTVVNVDGGLAGSLQTTSGQTIALRPEWADNSDVCSIMIFIAHERDPIEHLESRHDAIASRGDMESVTALQNQQLAGMILPGFTWRQNDGKGGAVYADLASINRLVHISISGFQCPLENLLPIFETLRFNIQR